MTLFLSFILIIYLFYLCNMLYVVCDWLVVFMYFNFVGRSTFPAETWQYSRLLSLLRQDNGFWHVRKTNSDYGK